MPYTQLYQSISTKNKVEAKRIHSMLRWYSWCNAGDVVTYLYKLRCLATCYHQSSIIIKITHKRTFVERATFVFVGRGVAFSKKKKNSIMIKRKVLWPNTMLKPFKHKLYQKQCIPPNKVKAKTETTNSLCWDGVDDVMRMTQ